AGAEKLGLVARSSNYELYGDMSSRVMGILSRMTMWTEVYSIDEAFIGLRGTLAEVHAAATHIKRSIHRVNGLPVCAGIAKTITLAQLSNQAAEIVPEIAGVCFWYRLSVSTLEGLLRQLRVFVVGGIVRKVAKRLHGMGIETIQE